MKTLKTLTVMLLLVSALAAAEPQRPPHPPMMPIDDLAVLLDLDDSQKAEVQRVLDEQRAAREAKRQEIQATGERPTREEMQAYREEAREAVRMSLQNVLTPEQLEKFEVLMKNRPGRGRPHPRRDAPDTL